MQLDPERVALSRVEAGKWGLLLFFAMIQVDLGGESVASKMRQLRLPGTAVT